MPRLHGPITDRLPVNSDSWTYHRGDEATDAVAADGYRLGNRWALVRRIQRRRRRALLLQFAMLCILCGAVAIAAAAAEIAADRIYDGAPDTTTPPWCWVSEAPEGFQQCEVTE